MTYFILFYNRSLSGSLEDTAVYKKLRIKVRSSFYAQFIYTIVGFTAFILQVYRKADSIFRKIIGINLTIV